MIFYADFCDYSFIFVGVRLMGVIEVKVNVWGEILSSNVDENNKNYCNFFAF